MKPLLILLFILFSYAINAQKIDQTNYRIHYACKFYHWENQKQISQDEKILDIGSNISKFYSLWEARNGEIKDSIFRKGGTLAEVQQALALSPYPRSYQFYIVYKNYPQKGMLTFTEKIMVDYIYEETMETLKWNIVPKETSTVAGYRCQKAQTHFRGRVWYAWFAEELPINDGPWKLWGLPGLILKAEDEKKDFSFECIQIEKKNEDMVMPKRKYIKCSPKRLKEIYILNGKDPNAYLRQLGQETWPGYDANGKELKYNKTAVLLEY